MTNAELIACIQAEEQGKKVEVRFAKTESDWSPHISGQWNTATCEYRIAREPRKCWVSWDPDGKPLVETYDNARFSDSIWQGEGWQLVTEEIR